MATTYYTKDDDTGLYSEADPFGDFESSGTATSSSGSGSSTSSSSSQTQDTAEDLFDVEKAKKATEAAKLYAGVAVGASKEKAQQLQEFKQQDETRDYLQAQRAYRY
jgi:hypothetical protein